MRVQGCRAGGFPAMAVVSGLGAGQIMAVAMNVVAVPGGRVGVRVHLDDRCARTGSGQDEEGEQCPA